MIGVASWVWVRPILMMLLHELRLLVERLVQVLQRREQVVVDLLGAGDVHGRRIGVVRRLAHIDMVVGMHRLLRAHHAAQHFDGAVGDHLIGIHVRLGAGTGLPDGQGEMVVELAVDHFLGGGDDGLAELADRGGPARMFVSAAARLTMPRARTIGRGLLFPADLEIAQRALGLGAPIAVSSHLDRSEGVGFGAGLGHRH